MNNEITDNSTKILMLVGSATGVSTVAEIDTYLSVVLKIVTIISFAIVIFLNVENVEKRIKKYFKKWLKQ